VAPAEIVILAVLKTEFMKIIVPMAGRGTRLRPHTLTVPKPLIKIAGKPIVQRLVEDLAAMSEDQLEEIAFVIGDFGKEVEEQLVGIAEKLGAKGSIYYQTEPLGTAHAILCAGPSLSGNVIVAFADTLFKADFKIDRFQDSIIYTQKVADPSAFGVVKVNEQNTITDFIEKPQEFVSDLAIIGIYYFRDGENLKAELQYLIDNQLIVGKEYQLTTALENMKNKGLKFVPGTVKDWLDCGNKNATVDTHQRYINYLRNENLVADSATIKNSAIINPVYIGENAVIENSIVGPFTSIGENSRISDSVIRNSLVQDSSSISKTLLENAMVGNHVTYEGRFEDISLGDYNTIKK